MAYAVARKPLSMEFATAVAIPTVMVLPYAASGTMDRVQVLSVRVSPDAHAFCTVSGADQRNVPAVAAVQTATSVIVSVVPPFVHGPTEPDS